MIGKCLKASRVLLNNNEILFVLDGHSMKDVIYKWKRDTVLVEKKSIAQFDVKDVQLRSEVMSYVTG